MKTDGKQAFPGKGRLKEDDELIRRLQRENELLRQEREVLKKALAIFSKGQPHQVIQLVSRGVMVGALVETARMNSFAFAIANVVTIATFVECATGTRRLAVSTTD